MSGFSSILCRSLLLYRQDGQYNMITLEMILMFTEASDFPFPGFIFSKTHFSEILWANSQIALAA